MKFSRILQTSGVIIGVTGTAIFLVTSSIENEFMSKFNSLSKAMMMLGLLFYLGGYIFTKINKK